MQFCFREETFGYLVFDERGGVTIVNSDAGDLLERGEPFDLQLYKPSTLLVNDPFYLSAPIIVMLEVTRKCNVNCGHCYIDAGLPRKDEMSTDALCRLIDELEEMKTFHLFITGGEPLMRHDIIDIINHTADSNLFVNIVTNGSLLTNDFLSSVKNEGNISFCMSFMGGLDNGYSNAKAFDLAKDRIFLLKEHGFPVMLWFCVTKKNFDQLYEVSKWCLDHDAEVVYTVAKLIGRCKENSSLLLDETYIEPFGKVHKKIMAAREKGSSRHAPAASRGKDLFQICWALEHSVEACKGGRSFAYVCSNGDVYPCSNCAGEDLLKAGNIREESFSNIWKNSFIDMRAITWESFKGCKTCDILESLGENEFCKLRCPPLSKALSGDPLYCGGTEYLKAVTRFRFASELRQF